MSGSDGLAIHSEAGSRFAYSEALQRCERDPYAQVAAHGQLRQGQPGGTHSRSRLTLPNSTDRFLMLAVETLESEYAYQTSRRGPSTEGVLPHMGLLDGRPLQMSNPDAAELVRFLYQTFTRSDEVELFARRGGVDLGLVNLDQPAAVLWQTVVIAACNQKKLRAMVECVSRDPNSAWGQPLLSRLLDEPLDDAAVETRPATPAMALPDNVYDAGLLWDDLPFIDRASLRDNLRLMMGGPQRRALLVIGADGSGKTYTRQFIYYLAERGGLRYSDIKPIDLSNRAGAPVDAIELAGLIAQSVARSGPPPLDRTAQAESVVSRFIVWLGDEVAALGEPRWLVFDGINPTTAKACALHLVDSLARAAANRDLGDIRVIVLGYSGSLANTALALSETLEHPTRMDVKVFFTRAATALQGVEPDGDALEALLDEFGPIEHLTLTQLGSKARDYAKAVFVGAT